MLFFYSVRGLALWFGLDLDPGLRLGFNLGRGFGFVICVCLRIGPKLYRHINVSFECGRHALHAAALRACGVAVTSLPSHILRFLILWVRR